MLTFIYTLQYRLKAWSIAFKAWSSLPVLSGSVTYLSQKFWDTALFGPVLQDVII